MTVTPDRFDIVVVDFPFAERQGQRKRPALILSGEHRNGCTGTAIIAMITRADAAPWPGDIDVARYDEAGLRKPCKVRLKLHTIDINAVKAVGCLHDDDRAPVMNSLRQALSL